MHCFLYLPLIPWLQFPLHSPFWWLWSFRVWHILVTSLRSASTVAWTVPVWAAMSSTSTWRPTPTLVAIVSTAMWSEPRSKVTASLSIETSSPLSSQTTTWCASLASSPRDIMWWSQSQVRKTPVYQVCGSKVLWIGSVNGLLLIWGQAITWTDDDLLSIGPFETNVREIWIKIQTFSFKKMYSNVLSAIWRPFFWSQCVNLQWPREPYDNIELG